MNSKKITLYKIVTSSIHYDLMELIMRLINDEGWKLCGGIAMTYVSGYSTQFGSVGGGSPFYAQALYKVVDAE